MRTKPLEAWSMKDLQYRRLRPDDIDSWGRTICLAYQWLGERKIHFIAEWQEGGRAAFLEKARDLLTECDVVVGHNMQDFDLPHLEGEFILEDMHPPAPSKVFDTLKVMRKHGNLENNQLDTLDKRFGFTGKSDKYRISMAMDAVNGDEKAQRKIELYNKGDIRATRRVYLRLRPVGNVNLGVFFDDSDAVVRCGACTGTKVQKRGVQVTSVSRFQRYQCTSCGAWGRGKKALSPTVEVR
jgi:hypothetical protein